MALDAEKLDSRWFDVKAKTTTRDANFIKLYEYYAGTLLKDELENETYRYVVNHLANTIDDYAVLESIVPEIQVPPPIDTEEGRKFADKEEKLLWTIWQRNSPAKLMQGMSVFKNLYGGAPINIHPDPKKNILRFTLGEPKNFHPVLSSNDETIFDEVYFTKSVSRENVSKLYGEKLEGDPLETVDVLYYWNKNEYAVEYDRKLLFYFEHNWGFVPWVVVVQKPYPNELLGASTIKWVLALNKYINELMSDYAEIIHYNAYPIVVGEGTGQTTETWLTGPNAYNEIKKGGKVSILESARPSLPLDNQIVRAKNDLDIGTGLPGGVMHGKVEHSIGSGKVITGLTAGTEIRIVSRQALMSDALQRMNQYSLKIIEKENLTGSSVIRGQRKGKTYAFKFSKETIKGYYENIIRWPIGLWDYPSKVVTVLQLVGAKLMSKYTGMEILGTRSPVDEQKRIADELMADLKMQAAMQQAQAPAPTGGELGSAEGEPIKETGEPALPPDAEKETIEAERMDKGATIRKRPKGRPKKGRPEPESVERVTLDEVSQALRNVPNLKGDVYLYGSLITDGYTDNDIDLLLTDLSDKTAIINALPQWRGRFNFKKIAKGEETKGSQLLVKAKSTIK